VWLYILLFIMPKRFKRKADRLMRVRARSTGASNVKPTSSTPTTGKDETNEKIIGQAEYREVPPVPDIIKIRENVLKKKKSLSRIESQRRLTRLEKQKKLIKEREKTPEKVHFISPEKIVKDFRKCYLQTVRMHQVQYMYSRRLPESNNKLALLVRIRGKHGMVPKIAKILKQLRLNTVCSASFTLLTPEVLLLLELVRPFITYGCPNRKTVRDLIYKRGKTKVTGKKIVNLRDNTVIEAGLGEHNVVCLEDIVHSIFECDENFQKVNSFLVPFKLNKPPDGFKNTRKSFALGGDSGDRGEKINELIEKMN